jgi:hypothetical protein
MADDSKIGTHWQPDELDAIVADYFEMLHAELAGQKYSKLAHSKALMVQIDRTHRSVEFKHQNISAVLDELGLPWIRGYIPKRNYQNAIIDAVDRYLASTPGVLDRAPEHRSVVAAPDVFVTPPAPLMGAILERLQRLVRKFDPVARDHRNRALGKAGEEFVFRLERERLTKASRLDLANRVRWVSMEDGDGAGYDIASFDEHSSPRLIEVKTTNGSARTPFYLTRNEHDVAAERPEHWRIYRVHLFASEPRVFTLAPPLDQLVNLRAEVWQASFRYSSPIQAS